jgi:hypothetical protein
MGQDVRYGCRQLVRNLEPSKAGSMLSPASKGLAGYRPLRRRHRHPDRSPDG